ncbi:methionine--tRNA ligase, mitochondrial [Ischnura elegans]|uniref:methionine--tRNA ligase, mitochondrial n=1 Tax=Ischnura elegans TaxID=197161 RepID=UPI001ED8936E|nr:methionine--tRNA ligase, mitochondrial [Ischnura elegans]
MRERILKLTQPYFKTVLIRSYYISTPIFYVNASPHIGHLYSVVIADATHRFQCLTGAKNVLLSTGTDEHGLKVELASRKDERSPTEFKADDVLQYCSVISSQFSSLFSKCSVNFSDFIRTTDTRHKLTVEKFWNSLKNNGQIYEGSYSGWYCVSDEAFLKDSQLQEVTVEKLGGGSKTHMVSIESGQAAEWTEEKNYMFRLSSFKDDLLHWLKDERVIQPAKFHHILKAMIEDVSLGDLSVSRPSDRIRWGIPVPGDATQSIYVWVDALANYLTAAKVFDESSDNLEPNLRNWPPNLQVIGKDILKFHGIYWPSLLMAVGLEPPRRMLVHSHWTVEGVKMSKSLGNVVNPFDLADFYTPDGLRYFLLREGVAHSDGNYSNEKAIKILNAELADTYGNLLNRCTGVSINKKREFPSLNQNDIDTLCSSSCAEVKKETAIALVESLLSLPDKTKEYYEHYEFNRVVDAVMNVLRNTNRFFEAHRPWDAAKQLRKMTGSSSLSDEPDISSVQFVLRATLALSLESLRISSIILQPIIPQLTSTLLDTLNVPKEERMWSNANQFCWQGQGKSTSQLAVSQGSPLFKRIVKDDS